MAKRVKIGHWLWVVPLFIATGSLCVWLFTLGAKSAETSAILSLLVSILSGTFTALTYFRTVSPPATPEQRRMMSRWARKSLAAGLTAALGLGLGAYYWLAVHKLDVDVIDHLPTREWTRMKANSAISIQIPGKPPERDNLALRFAIANRSTVGDCVVPAKLYIEPIFDRRGPAPADTALAIRPSQELRLDVSDALGHVIIKVTLLEPDLSCTVDLRIIEAILYN
ncbi:hypothetical protein [Nonomuraea jiangxiensis]|uniref:Uncharacterized protein n=1 Tax=Nonomuraea jiangxiensis TaxID=633440 RepID=A0A1G9S3N6_9ACTN|nr:hypothetical protein [Nonomuraea jiangxiensis]SDM30188.1 hypothetical protein SAMN05421869_14041 [Nonomuraea jiangxiensis]